MIETDTGEVELKSATQARAWKATLDISLHELARRVGTGEGFLSEVLHERRPATRRMLRRISFALSEAEAERQRVAAAEKPAPEPRIRRL